MEERVEVMTMAKTSEAQLRAQIKYEKKSVSQVCLKYVTKNNQEILDKLNSVPSKADYVRQLILQDLEREKKEANNK
jgi:predicted CopG family antitoxin